MGEKNVQRRAFLKKLTGRDLTGKDAPDALFERFSRKQLGARFYSADEEVPGSHNTANRSGNVTSGLAPYTGTWTLWEVLHLLRRTGYGIKKATADNLLAMTTSDAVDALLNITTTPVTPSATPLNHYQNTLADPGGIALGASWTSSNLTYTTTGEDTINVYRQQSLSYWSWGLMLNGEETIREKMVQFWYHFIPVNYDDVRDVALNSATSCHDYMKLLRDNALGNFFTLIKLIAKSPAMLVYLGNQFSTASAPNENFGRELLELFTMGKLPVQNYTEDDVKAAAKVLSGWRISSFTAAYPLTAAFNASYHNTTNKLFSSNFSNTTINGITGAGGAAEFDTFFNMLFAQQGTTIAQYVCRRLYRFFVYYDIDANVETNVIAPLAASLVAANWDILPVLKQLLKSEHFFDMANRGVMIKSPLDLMAGTIRNFNINTTPAAGASQVINQYAVWQNLHNYATNNLEQGYGLVPNVSGWKAYYQAPGYYQTWINTNTIQRRAAWLNSMMNGTTVAGLLIKTDVIAFVQQFPNATIQDPDLLVNTIVQYLLPLDLAQSYKDQLKIQNLLNNQVTNNYWTMAWNNYTGTPTNTSYLNTVKSRLTSLLTAIIQLAEYQLI